jgi:hypothetical protein
MFVSKFKLHGVLQESSAMLGRLNQREHNDRDMQHPWQILSEAYTKFWSGNLNINKD